MISQGHYIVINSPYNRYNGITGKIDKDVPSYPVHKEVMFYADRGYNPYRFIISEKDIRLLDE